MLVFPTVKEHHHTVEGESVEMESSDPIPTISHEIVTERIIEEEAFPGKIKLCKIFHIWMIILLNKSHKATLSLFVN